MIGKCHRQPYLKIFHSLRGKTLASFDVSVATFPIPHEAKSRSRKNINPLQHVMCRRGLFYAITAHDTPNAVPTAASIADARFHRNFISLVLFSLVITFFNFSFFNFSILRAPKGSCATHRFRRPGRGLNLRRCQSPSRRCQSLRLSQIPSLPSRCHPQAEQCHQ